MVKNLIISFFAKTTVAFTFLAILLVQSQQLGSSVVGQVSLLILNLAIIQAISDIYTGPALVYFIPRYNLSKLYTRGLFWTVSCILFINALFYLLDIGVKALWVHVLLLSLISTLNAFHAVILLGKEKMKAYNFLIFFQPVVLLIVLCLMVFVFSVRDVHAYILAAYVSWTSAMGISSFIVFRLLRQETSQNPDIPMLKVLRNGFINQLSNLAHILSNRYNYYIIGAAMLVGVYASASSLIESVWIVSGSISPVVLTYIANGNNAGKNSRITFLLSKISLALSVVCVIVLILIPAGFFTWLLGKDFSDTKIIMLYLSPGILFISFSSIISHYFSGLGQQKILFWANSSGLLVTLCSSYYFISCFGLIGACYSASLSYLAQALVLTVVFMKQNKFSFSELFQWKRDVESIK